MLWFIILTRVCNLNCIYCQNNLGLNLVPEPIEPSYTLEDLRAFIAQDPDATIAFYGGEPLLRLERMYEIMDYVPARRFVVQTNGTRLDLVDDEHLHRLDAILVSIDGRPHVNDYYRGSGNYRTVISNVKKLRQRGYSGDLIARMAVSGRSDIYEEVTHLLSLGLFDHIHWQLDVLWDYPPAQRYEDFDSWIARYNRGVSKLVELWVREMERSGRVLGIAPFQAVMYSLLTGEKTHLRCGAGIDAFAISTSGKILACPIAPEWEWNIVGDIWHSRPSELPWKVSVGEPCTSCPYYGICGGRCLFANKTMLWGREGFAKVCRTVWHLIDELKRVKPRVERLIRSGRVSLEDFHYPRYNNSIEVIP